MFQTFHLVTQHHCKLGHEKVGGVPERVTTVPSTVVRQGTKLMENQPRTGEDGGSSDSFLAEIQAVQSNNSPPVLCSLVQ